MSSTGGTGIPDAFPPRTPSSNPPAAGGTTSTSNSDVKDSVPPRASSSFCTGGGIRGGLSSLIFRFKPNFIRQLNIKARHNCSNITVAQIVAASWSNGPAQRSPTMDCYQKTSIFIETILPKMGISATVIDPADVDGLKAALNENKVLLKSVTWLNNSNRVPWQLKNCSNHLETLKKGILNWKGYHVPREINFIADKLAKLVCFS